MERTSVSFVLNGKEVVVETRPNRRLVDVLREDLRLTGTKEGCGTGHCGACAVILDGTVIDSCLTRVSKVKGRRVTTIEGIGSPEGLHPLQQAFIDNLAVQCGFCTPGIIVAAKALLDRNPNPTPGEVKDALEKNLCRCTGYVKIFEAVMQGAAIMRGEATPCSSTGTGIGHSVPRLGDLEKVSAKAQYAADLHMEGMLHAAILRSPHPHALIRSIDTSKALSLAGVECVLTAKDIPGINRVGIAVQDQPVLADDKVRQVGDPVALVAAISPALARKALSLIEVYYEPLPAVFDPFQALENNAPQIHDSGNLLHEFRVVRGDIEEGFARADVVVENVYTTPLIEHAYIEPEAGLAYLDEEGRVTLRVPTHSPHRDRAWAAAVLGIDVDRVRVVRTESGGDHGGKSFTAALPIYSSLALLVYKLGKPVKFVYTRRESFEATSKRHPFHIRCRLGATREGKITAVHMEVVANGGAYASTGPFVLRRAVAMAGGPYQVPNVHIVGKTVYTNLPFCGSFRGFGLPQVTFAMESQMDTLAQRLGFDPLELRLLNALEPGAETATRQILGESVGMRQTLEAVRSYYVEAKRRVEGERRDGDVRRGVGLASYWGAIGLEEMTDYAEARVELQEDGRLCIYTGSTDTGQGTHTILAQIAAEVMGLPMESITVEGADTAVTPDCFSGSASKQTMNSGNAVLRASTKLRKAILDVAARAVEQKSEDLYLADGFLLSRVDHSLRVPSKEVAAWCKEADVALTASERVEMPLAPLDPVDGHGILTDCYTFATHAAEVEVNMRTGKVQVTRVVAAQDMGKALHPKGCELQIEGGILIGLGYALKEEFISGKTRGFAQYHIPTMKDAPEIKSILVEVPEPSGPFGAKGFGEASQSPTAPAIINAICHATGVRVFDLPATPARLTKAFRQASGQAG